MKTTSQNPPASKLGRLTIRRGVAVGISIVIGMSMFHQAEASSLLNINFGQNESPTKVGFAAVGETANDFWNFYTRDGAGGWLTYGTLTDLKLADGTTTAMGVTLTVDNAPGSWGNGSSDPMYNNYLYPFSGIATIALTNMLAGQYDLYVYSHDGNYHLDAGGTDMGTLTCNDPSPAGVPIWQEGRQYVRFGGISVNAGDDVTLTVNSGLVDGFAVISGMQLVAVPEPSSMAIVLSAIGAATLARKRT